ncbi:MAG TPA: CbiX/SirB N-terminal domain-containing protein [Gammaproteobacteria bacterium]|nr:CbiX/SirB N-terminal domain-containing protein [Gammaproteobacteria bacterium]
MQALIMVAHGSRVRASNDEVRLLTAALAARVADRYQHTATAFLELADPSIGAAIDAAVAAGAREVVILPYFLAAGAHVARDIPAIVQERQVAHPTITIRLADYLGKLPGLVELLASSV